MGMITAFKINRGAPQDAFSLQTGKYQYY